MSGFDLTLKAEVDEGAAFGVCDAAGEVLGVILLGGEAPDHWIRWLAVWSAARQNGVGTAPLTDVLQRWPGPCTNSLATVGVDITEGRVARRLYERFGFVAGAMLPRGPKDDTRQRYTLVRP
jgi:GNAT superfamily N-acetyltransferase